MSENVGTKVCTLLLYRKKIILYESYAIGFAVNTLNTAERIYCRYSGVTFHSALYPIITTQDGGIFFRKMMLVPQRLRIYAKGAMKQFWRFLTETFFKTLFFH